MKQEMNTSKLSSIRLKGKITKQNEETGKWEIGDIVYRGNLQTMINITILLYLNNNLFKQ